VIDLDDNIIIEKDIVKELAKTKLNGTQFKIILTVIERTCDNGSRESSLAIISESTKCTKKMIARELKYLLKMKVLTEIIAPDYVNARVVILNKNINEWKDIDHVTKGRLYLVEGEVYQ
jgi:hypothetical protein